MIHKFVIELIDDYKGFEQDVDYLERIYGAEPIKEHDEEIYNKAVDDFSELMRNRIEIGCMFTVAEIDRWKEQLKVGGENGTYNQ